MKEISGIGESIKNCRLDKELTQPQLGKLVGVSGSAISFWENDINIPNVKACWLMADALGITIDELVGRDDL